MDDDVKHDDETPFAGVDAPGDAQALFSGDRPPFLMAAPSEPPPAGGEAELLTLVAQARRGDRAVLPRLRAILDGHVVLSRDLAQRGQYPAIDIAASLSRVMNDIVDPAHAALARRFRALVATYEANRDLVLMGAYRQGTDAQLDRAIAMHDRLTAFLTQGQAEIVPLSACVAQLGELLDA